MELSGAAARCYAACGRRRSAAAMRADVAAALATRGQAAAAAALYQRQAALLVGEGWPRLAATVLTKLAECQEVRSRLLAALKERKANSFAREDTIRCLLWKQIRVTRRSCTRHTAMQ